MASTTAESEIKTWLLAILKKENIKDLSLKILGNTEKGDGYIGDIVFVQASGITDDNLRKNYDLVLKCSKKSQELRERFPVREAFDNEILVFNKIFPYFTQFQLEKGITPFNNMPKCYGTFVGENTEIIVFENLRAEGYDLWPKKNPTTRRQLDLVLEGYAKYHAISVALDDQRPGKLQEFGNELVDVMKKFIDFDDTLPLYQECIDKIADMLQNELEESVLLKWRDFRKQVHFVFHDLIENVNGLKVMRHGDCWNNNFMYKFENGTATSVSILDWQLATYSSPVLDLCYHIFACISEEDLDDLLTILKDYHKVFSEQVRLLGSEPDVLYPFEQFLEDWQKYCKFGILLSCLVTKMCSAEKEEIVDLTESAEDGKDWSNSFNYDLKDTENYKRRMRPIVEFVVKNNLI